jgi:Bacterial Ig domain
MTAIRTASLIVALCLFSTVTAATAAVLDISWVAPTVNANGSVLNDLMSYRVYYGASPAPCLGPSFVSVPSATPSPAADEVVGVTLSGLSAGTLYYVSVTAIDASGNESDCSISASAVARVDFTVMPTGPVNFGTVEVGSFAEQTFVVQNTGGGLVAGSVTAPAPFGVVAGSPFSLSGAGATQAVTVRFSPSVAAAATANLTFTTAAGAISRVVQGTGVIVDTTAPTVTITAPATGTVSGTTKVSATASDNVGVAGVQFKLNGANLGAEDTQAPFSVSWNTTTAANGQHTLSAVVRDAAGNTSTAVGVIVNVANDKTPPLISQVMLSSITSSGATIRWTTDEPSNSQAQYGLTTAYGTSSTLDASRVTAHTVTLAGLAPNTLYHVRARSQDAAGNLGLSADFTLTTLSADVAPPTVSITAPSPGFIATGIVTITVAATDEGGVAGVQLQLDGVALGAELTTAPYTLVWNSATASDGAHTLAAVARDRAGNVATSASVALTTRNGIARLSPQDTSLVLNATNYSADTRLMTFTWPDRQVANAILMKFDFSALPAGAIVQQATLYLALVESDATADATYTVTAHKIVGKNPVLTAATGYTADGVTQWTPNPCCSASVPLAQADISPAYDSRSIDKTPGYKAWVLTVMVQEWMANPATNAGLLLNADASKLLGRYRYFASVEHADTTLRPYLQITYTVPAAVDRTPPTVALTVPAPGAHVAGLVTVAANAADDTGVAGIQFQLDGVALGPEQTAAPYRLVWDSGTASDGAHTLSAVARDLAGNTARADAVAVTVGNGSVRLSPEDTSLLLNATNYSADTRLLTFTWPDRQVANAILMKFDFGALPAGAIVQQATLYLALVESDATADATYTVTAHKIVGKSSVLAAATGYTADGATAWTSNVCCAAGVPLAQADISPAYDSRAVDKTPGYKSWTLTTMVQEWLDTPASNAGLLLNSDASKLLGRYRYFASMEHADSALRPYLQISYTVPAAVDRTPPVVAFTAPAPGVSVAGRVAVAATASDDIAVAGVQFLLDGVPLGAEVTVAPYTVDWDSSTATNGEHTLTAVARDRVGNSATATVGIIVANIALEMSLAPEDTFIDLSANNFSAATVLKTFTWPDRQAANAVLLKFDLSAIPAGAVIHDATLHLALVETDATSEPTYTVTVHKIVGKAPVISKATGYAADPLTDWTPNVCCYAGAPLAQADISVPYDTRAVDKSPGDKSWTITTMVREWLLAPTTNVGLLLNADVSALAGRYRFFASAEHPTRQLRPTLTITYSVPVEKP